MKPIPATAAKAQEAYREIETDDLSREETILALTPMVKRIALSMYNHISQLAPLEDLISAGTVGLIEAISRFDPTLGVPLQAYAARRIRGAIQDDLRRLDPMSRTQRGRVNQKERLVEKLTAELGREPTADELADEAGLTLEEWQLFDRDAERVILVADSTEEGTPSFLENLPINQDHETREGLDNLLRGEEKRLLTGALKKLPEKLYLIVSLYYYSDFNYKEIGQILGVSESRVCQLHSKAVRMIRQNLDKEA